MKILLLWLTLAHAWASSTTTDIRSGAYADTAEVVWTDPSRLEHRMSFSLPPGSLAKAAVYRNDPAAVAAESMVRLKRWADGEGIPLEVLEVEGKTTRWRTPSSQMARVTAQRDAIVETLRQESFVTRRGENMVGFDHGRLAAAHVEVVKPVATAVGPMLVARELATRALSFVQGMPYKRGDGFRTPLAVVRDNRGDCDEKAVFFAAMIRAVDPSVPVAVVTMKGHAFVGIGLQPLAGETTVEIDGRRWVVAESAGPGVLPLGTVGEKSQAAIDAGTVLVWEVPATP